LALVITRALLADIPFNPYGRDKELALVPADGCITEQGRGFRLRQRFKGGQIKTRMSGWYKGCYRPAFFAKPHFPRPDIDTDTPAAGKFIQRSPVGELYKILCRDRKGIPAGAPHHVKRGIFIGISLAVGIKQI